jgi:hypothetical protein
MKHAGDDEHGVGIISGSERRRGHPVENVGLDAGVEQCFA